MKKLHIFRAGKHTASGGDQIDFSETVVAQIAHGYDPAKHEAPIVIGHPASNGPAYGWVRSLSATGADLDAEPHQVDQSFMDMVAAGRFKKISASFYTPDAPNNPTPGSYYLRHVGFLGAQPPAVKGLRPVQFDDGQAGGIIEFTDDYANSSLWRRLREFLIGKYGVETADEVAPSYLVQSLEDDARKPSTPPQTSNSFQEHDAMTKEELDARAAELNTREAAIKTREDAATAKETSFADRESAIATRERAIATGEISTWLDQQIAAGRVTPAEKPTLAAFAETLDRSKTADFGEYKGLTQYAAWQKGIEARAKVIAFGEHAAPGGDMTQGTTTEQHAAKIAAHRQAEAGKGRNISFAEAAAEIAKAA
jgi:hypothetical protein